MIGKVLRTMRVEPLLAYLYGPGRRNEHTDPHLVAGYDLVTRLEPAVPAPGRRPDVRPLAALLDEPLRAPQPAGRGRRRSPNVRRVWHCAVRAAPGDRGLSDAEWARVAAAILRRTGLAGSGERPDCRWVAVRHAEEHIHLVVTLVHGDGTVAEVWRDRFRVAEACAAAARELGLAEVSPWDRTVARAPSWAECERAVREGRPEPVRCTLRRRVQVAAAGASGTDDFADRLRRDGLLVRFRLPDGAVRPCGYAVALPGYRTATGRPVWFGGGALAPDLTLPRLLHRWEGAGPCHRSPSLGRERVLAAAAFLAAGAEGQLRQAGAGDPVAAAIACGAANLYAAAARLLHGRDPGPLSAAADDYARAARLAGNALPVPAPAAAQLGRAARDLLGLGRLASPGEAAAMHALLPRLAALAEALAALRDREQRAFQAAAASRAAAATAAVYEAAQTAATEAAATARPVVEPVVTARPVCRPVVATTRRAAVTA